MAATTPSRAAGRAGAPRRRRRPGGPPGPDRGDARWRRTGLAAWAVLVTAALAWGTARVAGSGVSLDAAPLSGRWAWHGDLRLAPAVALGAAVVTWGPAVAARLPWRAVPVAAGATGTAWAVALGAADGWGRLTAPIATRWEYEPFAATVRDLPAFLSGFVGGLDSYPTHVRGHPPGPVVAAWALDRVGLGGAGWLAAVALLAWGAATAATLVAARSVAGEAAARRAAPALAVLPAAVWAATSLDALFAGLIAGACALAAVAAARGSSPVALAAGVAWGAALACTYGAVPLVAVTLAAVPAAAPAAAAAAAPRSGGGNGSHGAKTAPISPGSAQTPAPAAAAAAPRSGGGNGSHGARTAPISLGSARTLALAAAGALAVLGALAAAGFWWPDGLAATRRAYWDGLGAQRPGWYLTAVGNPGALALAVGPAVAAGLAAALAATGSRLLRRPRRLPPAAAALPLAALAAVAAADLSQLSRGEVERIWLPFVPWLALAAPGDRRAWLAAQVALGLVLQSVLVSPW